MVAAVAAVLVAVVGAVVVAAVQEGVWMGAAEVLWLAGWRKIAVNLYNEETHIFTTSNQLYYT